MNNALRYIPFIGVIFAAVFFYKYQPDGLIFKEGSWTFLTLASFVLYVSLLFRALVWGLFLRGMEYPIKTIDAITIFNLAVLAKYIPGKVWPTISIARMTAPFMTGISEAAACTLGYQAMASVAGVIIGFAGVLAVAGMSNWSYLLPPTVLLGIGVYLEYSNGFVAIVRRIGRRWLVEIPPLERNATCFLCLHAVQWILLVLSFWIFFRACNVQIELIFVFLQALANVGGFLFAITPAGLGAREAGMIVYLDIVLGNLGTAVLLSAAARLWFFGVEIAIFGTGVAVRLLLRL